MSNTKKDRLIQRINDNYRNCIMSISGVSRTRLVAMSGRIATVIEVHEFLTTHYKWDDESELEFLLIFRDPLTIIADAWERYKAELMVDIDAIMWEMAIDRSIVSEYPLVDGVCDNFVHSGV